MTPATGQSRARSRSLSFSVFLSLSAHALPLALCLCCSLSVPPFLTLSPSRTHLLCFFFCRAPSLSLPLFLSLCLHVFPHCVGGCYILPLSLFVSHRRCGRSHVFEQRRWCWWGRWRCIHDRAGSVSRTHTLSLSLSLRTFPLSLCLSFCLSSFPSLSRCLSVSLCHRHRLTHKYNHRQKI